MMTFILVASGLLIAFIGLLRYDIHKHKHSVPAKNNLPDKAAVQDDDADKHNEADKT